MTETGTSVQAIDIDKQLSCFDKGTQFIKLLRAASAGKGIKQFTKDEESDKIERFDKDKSGLRIAKFVPSSGAATRMFKRLLTWRSNPQEHRKEINKFFKELDKFAFFDALVECANLMDVESFETGFDAKLKWLNLILEDGLSLASKPKGLIPFHFDKAPITPVREHLIEASHYTKCGDSGCIHFTVSPEHQDSFEKLVAAIKKDAPSLESVSVTFSIQKEETNTIATSMDGEVLRDENDEIVVRPGGHGALIHNLAELEADIVFIKNIDNVCHPRLIEETIRSKKMLGGTLLELRADLNGLALQVSKGLVDATSIDEVRDKWGLRIPRDYVKLMEYLKRPIRVCGMVKNEGEPGGGPFWCLDKYTGESLQIVEQSQVNSEDMRQGMILKSATHFNPVDLVCCKVDLNGDQIDLKDFVDNEQYFVAKKSLNGEDIKALEWPGLWNGAMAHWITVFVEVPIVTFNPVKELNDLLRENHIG